MNDYIVFNELQLEVLKFLFYSNLFQYYKTIIIRYININLFKSSYLFYVTTIRTSKVKILYLKMWMCRECT